jgi:hypothetical protein
LTVTLGNANVGVAVMVGDNSMVGVKVTVGAGVDVLVRVAVGSGVSVAFSVAVGTGRVGAGGSCVDGAQAERNRKINRMIL